VFLPNACDYQRTAPRYVPSLPPLSKHKIPRTISYSYSLHIKEPGVKKAAQFLFQSGLTTFELSCFRRTSRGRSLPLPLVPYSCGQQQQQRGQDSSICLQVHCWCRSAAVSVYGLRYCSQGCTVGVRWIGDPGNQYSGFPPRAEYLSPLSRSDPHRTPRKETHITYRAPLSLRSILMPLFRFICRRTLTTVANGDVNQA
jgi:hypothetical protein